jgi:hypothetical protein
MRLWRAYFPSYVSGVGSTHEVHSTAADVHRTRVSPSVQSYLDLTTFQTHSSGMVGQYPAAPLIGKLVDYCGPWVCSLIASVLFTSTFGLSAWTYASTPQDLAHPSSLSFKILVTCFGFAGLAQACS